MAKILLVEDDNNLREIYEARLQAEGYQIVSARDGEEALVVAKAEKPDLVISDVMMPKISGFEMLDILRNTDGLKDVKVVMLTALGQADDQQRANKLGADRYLVKSQVTLEDIVKAAHDLLGDEGSAATTTPGDSPVATPAPAPSPAPDSKTAKDDKLMNDAVTSLIADTEDKKDEPKTETKSDEGDNKPSVEVASSRTKVIKPLEKDPSKDIHTLLAEEEAKEGVDVAGTTPATTGPATIIPAASDTTSDASSNTDGKQTDADNQDDQTKQAEQAKEETDAVPAVPAAAEEASMDAQIENFVAGASSDPTPPAQPTQQSPEQPPQPPPPHQTPAQATSSQPQTTPQQQPAKTPPSDPNIISL